MATWTNKVDDVDYPQASHINDLQDEKLDRDGEIKATGTIQWDKGADIASANPLVLGKDGNFFHVTGTTNFAAINAVQSQPGTVICLVFDGILTMTHHATNLILPGGANIITAAGDRAIFIEESADKWRCINYIIASGSINLGIGGQIKFPATAVPSADPNTIDDYRERYFTAILTCGTSGTITVNPAYDQLLWTKIGRLVFIQGRIRISAVDAPTGALIMNIPFTSGIFNEDADSTMQAIGYYDVNALASGGSLMINVSPGADVITIQELTTTTIINAADKIKVDTQLLFGFWYAV